MAKSSKTTKENEPIYCVVKTTSKAWNVVSSLLLAIGGAVTAAYVVKYLAKEEV